MSLLLRAGLAPAFIAAARHPTRIAAARHTCILTSMPPRRLLHTTRPRLSAPPPPPEKESHSSSRTPHPSPTIRERIVKVWSNIKYLFRFYLNGVKQIWRNRERVKAIKADLQHTGRLLTWEETQLFRTHTLDMRKLPLFLLILVTVEELLPLMVIYTPFMLPSTCILPSQRMSIMKRVEVKRKAAVVELRRQVDGDTDTKVPIFERTDTPDEAGQALAAVEPRHIRELAVVYNQSLWGGVTLQRQRIARHLAMLRADDPLLASSRLMNAPDRDVRLLEQACTERGIRAVNTEPERMHELLRQWLLYTAGRPLSTLSLAFLPVRLSSPVDAVSIELEKEIADQNCKGLVEQTSTVVKEVVEEEKRNESNK